MCSFISLAINHYILGDEQLYIYGWLYTVMYLFHHPSYTVPFAVIRRYGFRNTAGITFDLLEGRHVASAQAPN